MLREVHGAMEALSKVCFNRWEIKDFRDQKGLGNIGLNDVNWTSLLQDSSEPLLCKYVL